MITHTPRRQQVTLLEGPDYRVVLSRGRTQLSFDLNCSQGGSLETNTENGKPISTSSEQAFKEKVKGSKNAGLHKAANIENKEALEDNYFAHFQQFLRNLGGRGQQPGFT